MIPNPTRILVAAGALALAATLPAVAQAGTITYEGDTLVYTAAPGETNRTGPWEGVADTSKVTISDGYGVVVTSQTDRCAPIADRFECDVPARLVYRLGDGDDGFTVSSLPWDIPVEVDAGPGNDDVSGYAVGSKSQRHMLDGGAGDDKLDAAHGDDVVRGGPGDDTVDGGDGNDTVEGGDGNDTIYGDHYWGPGTDTIDGGAGFDYMESDYVDVDKDFNPPVQVSFDGVQNDGRPGENDNIVGVEKIASSVPGTFTGSGGDDDVFVKGDFSPAVSTVQGLGGNDKLVGHDQVEQLDGGPGDDAIEGGLNDDTLTGGPGRDTILGDSSANTCNFLACRISFGNDTIHARDGEKDSIDCGVGDDTATVDAIDVVANCEHVDKDGSGPGPGPDGSVALAVKGGKLRKALRKGLVVQVRGLAAGAPVKVKVRRGKTVVASGKGKAGADGRAVVRARFTAKARRSLRGKRSVRLTVVAGAATKAVRLKR